MYSLLLILRLPSSGCADRQVPQRRDIACSFTLLVMRIPHIMIKYTVCSPAAASIALLTACHTQTPLAYQSC